MIGETCIKLVAGIKLGLDSNSQSGREEEGEPDELREFSKTCIFTKYVNRVTNKVIKTKIPSDVEEME